MSVSISSDRNTGYDGLEHQYIRFNQNLYDADLTGGQGEGGINSVKGLQPAEGLLRGQKAELVGITLDAHSLTVVQQSGQGTTPGSIKSEVEVSFGDDGGDTIIQQDPAEEDQVNLVDNATVRHELNNSIYFHHSMWGQQPFNDTTNGSGGGGQATETEAGIMKNLRRQFGSGPVAHRGDSVTIGAALKAWQVDNEDVRSEKKLVLHWDVFEDDDR